MSCEDDCFIGKWENSLELTLCQCAQPGVKGTAIPEGDQEWDHLGSTCETCQAPGGDEESKHRQEGKPLPTSPGRRELNPGRDAPEHATPKHQDLRTRPWGQTLGLGWVCTQGLKMEGYGG